MELKCIQRLSIVILGILLIVLNGIEIFENSVAGFGGSLLIVLNGIEMRIEEAGYNPQLSFNRTKWN